MLEAVASILWWLMLLPVAAVTVVALVALIGVIVGLMLASRLDG